MWAYKIKATGSLRGSFGKENKNTFEDDWVLTFKNLLPLSW